MMAHSPKTEEKHSKHLQQEEMKAHSSKTEEKYSKHLQQSEEGQSHTFSFRYGDKKHAVACDTSKTVLDALSTNQIFKTIIGDKKNKNKEIVIQRSKGGVPRAAVNSDFPCCLIEKDELLDITFIKSGGNVPTKRKTQRRSFCKEKQKLVTFTIKTKGGEKVKRLMRNNELRKKVEDVCVFAFKEDRLKDALRQDGRFINAIFKKHCALFDFGNETDYQMSQTVEHLDGKHFEIIVICNENQPESQEEVLSDKLNEVHSPDLADNTDHKPCPIDTEHTKNLKKSMSKSTNPTNSQTLQIIPDSKEILRILHFQHQFLLKTLLKRQENVRRKSEVQKVLRAEYDKSVQSFSEVFKIRQLMDLSHSVCQIRVEGSARGSGFLLFNRFIITNAHVVRDCLELSSAKNVEAAFDYERLASEEKLVPVKQQIPAYCYITDANKSRLDFALLELDAVDELTGRPELLSYYSPGVPSSGGVCIVGHPDGGIKKMDPCFIIRSDKTQEAVDEQLSQNVTFIHVISQRAFEEKWDFYGNQINYNSCFFHGTSGSPVFDEDCKLIGVHTGGYVYKGKGDKTRSIMEYGYTMQPILDMIRAQAKVKGLSEIVNILENYSRKSNPFQTPEQPNKTEMDTEMMEEAEFVGGL